MFQISNTYKSKKNDGGPSYQNLIKFKKYQKIINNNDFFFIFGRMVFWISHIFPKMLTPLHPWVCTLVVDWNKIEANSPRVIEICTSSSFFCGKMKIENGKTRFKRGHLQKLDLFIFVISKHDTVGANIFWILNLNSYIHAISRDFFYIFKLCTYYNTRQDAIKYYIT